VRIVHDGVVTRSVRDTAAFVREAERAFRNLALPPVGDVTHPGTQRLRVGLILDSIGVRHTEAQTRAAVQGTASLLEGLGHVVEETSLPDAGHFEDDFLLYWASLALAISRTGRLTFNRTYDRRLNDNLTQGLARHAARNLWRLPAAITRLNRSHRLTESIYASYDVLLTPVLTLPTPELGWLDPSQDYETVIGRILEWIAFTPVQNATGEPAISLPMGRTTDGMPIGVHLSAPRGYDRRLLELAFELEEARPFTRIQD
jgi:amidase